MFHHFERLASAAERDPTELRPRFGLSHRCGPQASKPRSRLPRRKASLLGQGSIVGPTTARSPLSAQLCRRFPRATGPRQKRETSQEQEESVPWLSRRRTLVCFARSWKGETKSRPEPLRLPLPPAWALVAGGTRHLQPDSAGLRPAHPSRSASPMQILHLIEGQLERQLTYPLWQVVEQEEVTADLPPSVPRAHSPAGRTRPFFAAHRQRLA